MQAKVAVKRKRRRHSKEFRAEVVMACRQPGVSVAAVALEHGLNANLLRRWIKEHAGQLAIVRPTLGNAVAEPLTVVPVTVEPGSSRNDEAIRIDIRRSGLAVQLAWPASRVVDLNGLLKELLR